MSYIVAVKTSFPKNSESQDNIAKLLTSIWPDKEKHIYQFSKSSTVNKRHLTLPLSEYPTLGDIGERSLKWLDEAVNLQKNNILYLQENLNFNLDEISLIASTTVTGLAVPTLEARLMNVLSFSPNTKRLPIFGLGCLGGVAGLNRVKDYLDGHPREAALLLATELCSLTFQFKDISVANLVGTSLFADGAAAVLMVGKDHRLAKSAQFEIIDTRSFFYSDTERMMGWDIVSSGFQIVLSGDVPKLVSEKVAVNMNEFLNLNKLKRNDISFFISHPGGPKVLEAITEISGGNKEDFKISWDSLAEKGNMSSVSVLHVMEETLNKKIPVQNSLGLMLAMGPAFCSEMNIIRKL
ncbi:MAG: hypothetical protein Q7U04_00650 [Bacteriovorax sp.]|nr:hypothetical protein [Bacteriovorax sp.]